MDDDTEDLTEAHVDNLIDEVEMETLDKSNPSDPDEMEALLLLQTAEAKSGHHNMEMQELPMLAASASHPQSSSTAQSLLQTGRATPAVQVDDTHYSPHLWTPKAHTQLRLPQTPVLEPLYTVAKHIDDSVDSDSVDSPEAGPSKKGGFPQIRIKQPNFVVFKRQRSRSQVTSPSLKRFKRSGPGGHPTPSKLSIHHSRNVDSSPDGSTDSSGFGEDESLLVTESPTRLNQGGPEGHSTSLQFPILHPDGNNSPKYASPESSELGEGDSLFTPPPATHSNQSGPEGHPILSRFPVFQSYGNNSPQYASPESSVLGDGDSLFTPPPPTLAHSESHSTAPDSCMPHASSIDSTCSSCTGTATPNGEDILVTTPILHSHGLAFNKMYNMIICVPCAVGFPLRTTLTHMKNSKMRRMTWNKSKNKWSPTEVYVDHNDSDTQITKSYLKKVKQSLLEAGYISNPSDIIDTGNHNEWLTRTSKIRGNSKRLVPGLTLYRNAFQCSENGCDKITVSHLYIDKHWRNVHGTKTHTTPPNPIEIPAVQTLCESVGGWVSYFEVEATSIPNSNQPSDLASVGALQSTQERLRAKVGRVVNNLEAPQERDTRTVLPVYTTLKIDNFLNKFDRRTIRQPFKTDKKDPTLIKLRQILVQSFYEDTKKVVNLHASILMRMTNCTEYVSILIHWY